MVNRHSLQWRNDITGRGGSEGDHWSAKSTRVDDLLQSIDWYWPMIAIFIFFYSFLFLLVTAKLSLRRHQNCNDTKRYKYQIKLKIIWIDELNKMLVLIKCFKKNVNLSTKWLRSYVVWLVDPPFQLLATCTRCYQWSSSWFFFFFRFNNFKRNNIKYIIKYF